MHLALGIFLTLLMGTLLGLLAGGGSILAVPILVYVIGLDVHEAIAISLILVGGTAFLAALLHARDSHVSWEIGLIFAAIGAPVSFLGAEISKSTPKNVLLLLFGVLMLIVGITMLRARREPSGEKKRNIPVIVLSAAAVGFLAGFLGVGGGMLIVPPLLLFLRMPMKTAIGTALLVIAANCAVGFWWHRESLGDNWNLLLPLSLPALAGTSAGVAISRRFKPPQLKKVFGLFVMTIGVWMTVKNGLMLMN